MLLSWGGMMQNVARRTLLVAAATARALSAQADLAKVFRRRVLYEDNHVLAFDKPAGVLSQGDRTGDQRRGLRRHFLAEGRGTPLCESRAPARPARVRLHAGRRVQQSGDAPYKIEGTAAVTAATSPRQGVARCVPAPSSSPRLVGLRRRRLRAHRRAGRSPCSMRSAQIAASRKCRRAGSLAATSYDVVAQAGRTGGSRSERRTSARRRRRRRRSVGDGA